jgi:predicted HicB family RNase H-like nuclease
MNNESSINRQVDKKTTMQIRIDTGLHQLLKIKAAKAGVSIKTLLEGYLANLLAPEGENFE